MTIPVPFGVKINECDNSNDCKVRAFAGLPVTIRNSVSLNPKPKGERRFGVVLVSYPTRWPYSYWDL